MNVTLNPALSRLIEHEVESGRFSNAEEVIIAGVTRVLAESETSADDLADLQIDAEIGIQHADRGEFAEFTADDIIKKGREILKKRAL